MDRAPINIIDPATGIITRGNPGTSPRHKARMAALKIADPVERARLLAEADKLSRAWDMSEPVTTQAKPVTTKAEQLPKTVTTEPEQFEALSAAERMRRHRLAKKLISNE